MDGHFPDGFPPGEDAPPANGNPHPIHGVPVINPNVVHHWHHDMAGAANDVHVDMGMNDHHMHEAQEDLMNHDQAPEEEHHNNLGQQQDVYHHGVPQHPEQPQDSISFD